MKQLNKVYPLVTRFMWWELMLALLLFFWPSVVVKVGTSLPLNEYLAIIAAGVVLMSIPIFGFVLQFQARGWVRKHCVGVGKGILYLANGTKDTEVLRAEVADLCRRDAVEEAAQALRSTSPGCIVRKPPMILAIAQYNTVQPARRRGKPWRILGHVLGVRIWTVWHSSNAVGNYRAALGCEIGGALLNASGYAGAGWQRSDLTKEARLRTLFFARSRERWSQPNL